MCFQQTDYGQGRSQKLHVGGGLVRHVRDGCRLTIHPTPPPSAPAPLGIHRKYLNVFECTQPYFVLLQETLKFFFFALWGGARPPRPPSGYASETTQDDGLQTCGGAPRHIGHNARRRHSVTLAGHKPCHLHDPLVLVARALRSAVYCKPQMRHAHIKAVHPTRRGGLCGARQLGHINLLTRCD